MRVLIAPDDFAGTLTAAQAAESIAAGWLRGAPSDSVRCLPLSDGGPGFAGVVAMATDAHVARVEVRGPRRGGAQSADIVLVDGTAYVESAQACGLALLDAAQRDPMVTSTVGVGDLLLEAKAAGAQRIVVGLGGSGTCDGGAGMLAALGARARDATGQAVPLDEGGGVLGRVASIELGPALETLAGIQLVAATDVDAPLLGNEGAARGFAPQKGASPADVDVLEAALERFAAACDGSELMNAPGAGAAGGLGFALMLLGAARASGIQIVRELVGFDAAVAVADVVVTGEGRFDWQSLRGKVLSGVLESAQVHGRPVVVIAGQVAVGRREAAAHGVVDAYAVSDAGPAADPAAALADRAASVARQWSPKRPGAR